MSFIWFIAFIITLVNANSLSKENKRLRAKIRDLQQNRSPSPAQAASASPSITKLSAEERQLIANLTAKTTVPPSPTIPVPASSPVAARPNKKFVISCLDFALQGPKGLLSLFYLGAFFIVAAALVFVNSDVGATTLIGKMLVITIVTLIFAFGGFFVAQNKRLRVAGIVYAGIALILIPIDGIAYYNFANTSGQMVNAGLVWLTVSLIFSGLSWFYYRSIMKNQLMYQFILTGIFSTLWSLLYLCAGRMIDYCLVSVLYGLILELASTFASGNQKVLRANSLLFTLVGCLVGFMAAVSRLEFFQSLVFGDVMMVLFPTILVGYFGYRFTRERSDGHWYGIIIGTLLTIAGILIWKRAGVNTWCVTGIILAYLFGGLDLYSSKLTILSPRQKAVFASLAPIFLIMFCLVGMIAQLIDKTSMTWGNSYLFFVYPMVATTYHCLRRLLLHRSAAGTLTGCLIWAATTLATGLVLSRAETVVWGSSYYLFGFLCAGIALINTTWLYPREKLLLRGAATTIIALTFFCLLTIGYFFDLEDMPFAFFLIPWFYVLFRLYLTVNVGWHLANFGLLIMLGLAAMKKLDATNIINYYDWYGCIWVQLLGLSFLGHSLWTHHFPSPKTSDFRGLLDAAYSLSLLLSILSLAGLVLPEDPLSPGQLHLLFWTAGDIAFTYQLASRYYHLAHPYLDVSALWVVWWWLLAGCLRLESVQWYYQPLIYYFLMRPSYKHMTKQAKKQDYTMFAYALAASAASWRLFSGYTQVQRETGILLSILTGVAGVGVGFWWRQQLLRRVGWGIVIFVVGWLVAIPILQIITAVLTELFGLPVWVWFGLIGAGLLAAATWILRHLQK